MATNRRNFLKTATLAGAGAMAGSIVPASAQQKTESNLSNILSSVKKSHAQRFNMSGYAAPALEKVRVGVIGLGDRGVMQWNVCSLLTALR